MSLYKKCRQSFTPKKNERADVWQIPLNKGMKFDNDKNRWGLMNFRELDQVVEVITLGAKKYGDNNWQLVENAKERYFDALMRHITAWKIGEKIDEELGTPHLANAACNLLFLLWFDNEENKKEAEK